MGIIFKGLLAAIGSIAALLILKGVIELIVLIIHSDFFLSLRSKFGQK